MAKKRANGEGTIFQRKDGRWSAQMHTTLADGTSKRLCTIRKNREDVKLWLSKAQIQEHKAIPFTQKNWTVAEYLDYWLQVINRNRIRETTFISYETIIRLHIKPLIGKKKLKMLNVRDIQLALDCLRKSGKSGNAGQQFIKILRACLNQAMREDIVFRNVAMLVEKPKHTAKSTEIWTVEQSKHFLEVHKNHHLYLYFLLLITYGMRRGEGMGIRWSDVDFVNDKIYLRQQVGKIGNTIKARELKTANSMRDLDLLPHIKEVMLLQAKKRNFIIPPFNPKIEISTDNLLCTTTANTPLQPRNLMRSFHLMTKQAGLPIIKIHALRHTSATLLKDLKTPMKDIQKILGHAHYSTTANLYTHSTEKTCTEALNALGAVLFAKTI